MPGGRVARRYRRNHTLLSRMVNAVSTWPPLVAAGLHNSAARVSNPEAMGRHQMTALWATGAVARRACGRTALLRKNQSRPHHQVLYSRVARFRLCLHLQVLQHHAHQFRVHNCQVQFQALPVHFQACQCTCHRVFHSLLPKNLPKRRDVSLVGTRWWINWPATR